jgi:multimeric flavodoxin WrbA
LEAVKDCDVLVIASAIYYGDVTSQTKAFIDRTFSYIKPDYLTNPQPSRLAPGKKVLWITSQEDSDPNRYEAVDNYSRFFGYFGMESSSIRAAGVGKYGQVNVGEEYLNQAKEAAQRLVC